MKLEISLVPYGVITQTLAGLAERLVVASKLTAGRSNVDDLVRLFLIGQYSLWVIYDADAHGKLFGFFAVEIKAYPQRRMLCVQHCVIDPHHLDKLRVRMDELLEQYAKDNGCTGIEFVGRPGWKKYTKTHGYHSQSVTYQRFFDLNQEQS